MSGQEAAQQTLSVGDRIELRHGPFLSTWRVAKLLEHGALLEYVGDVRFVGHVAAIDAPDGTPLTDHPDQAWLGRAHFAAAKRLEPDETADQTAEDRLESLAGADDSFDKAGADDE